jgi:endogenous inhibitor of DNA gyrase (YacG/DUF329 family)
MARCPTCRGPSKKDGNKLFPFCCERCQLLDLGRWLNEDYRVPDEPDASGGGVESSKPQRTDEN